MVQILGCPVSATLEIIGKKWTINIINDILFGKHRFNEIKDANPGLTSKILSERLKTLEAHGVVSKLIIDKSPVTINYELTELGDKIRYILIELALFSVLNQKDTMLSNPDASEEDIIESVGEMYQMTSEEYSHYLQRSKIQSTNVIG